MSQRRGRAYGGGGGGGGGGVATQSQSQQPTQTQTQRATQNVHVPALPVHLEATRLTDVTLRTFAGSLESVQAQLKDVATTFVDVQQDERVQGLRSSTVEVLKLEHEVNGYLGVLRALTAGDADNGPYAPDATTATCWKEELAQAAADEMEHSRFDIRRSKVLQDFDAATDNRGRPSGAEGAEEAEPEQEEDFVIGGGGQQELLNNRCPLTGKNVLELEHPVEDQFGYIYEHEAIRHRLTQSAARNAPCACPIAGTAHNVRVADLRPSGRVKRARRREMLQGATQTQGGGRGTQAADDVFDVEDE